MAACATSGAAGRRIHTEELYQLYDDGLGKAALNRNLREWEHVYNTVRLHQALNGLTLLQFLQQQHNSKKWEKRH